jgi:hypothetical protein
MGRQKIKVYNKNGVEIKDEWLRKRTLAANRLTRKPRKPEVEENIRRNRQRTIEDAKNKPYVTGIKWNLASHLREDICDKLATQDLYGLGPGVYPVEKYPVIPHDNCHCWNELIFDNDYFKNYKPSPEELKRVKSDPKYPEFKKWAKNWLRRVDPEYKKKKNVKNKSSLRFFLWGF